MPAIHTNFAGPRSLRLLFSATLAVAAALYASSVQAQTPNTSIATVNTLNLLAPFLDLNATPMGQATLAASLNQAIQINNGATLAQQQLAISDANLLSGGSNSVVGLPPTMLYGPAANLAGGLPPQMPVNGIIPRQPIGGFGPVLGPIYQAGVSPLLGPLLPNTVNLLTTAIKFTEADAAGAKFYFANGTTPPPLIGQVAVPPAGYTLPSINGLPNATNSVYDLAYGVTNQQPGQDPFGNSRPFQVSAQINQFAPTSISGLAGSPSFPSGHSTYAYTDSMLLGMMVPELYQSMLLRGSEFANSRVVIGAHYPMDVIGARALSSYDLAQYLSNPNYINNAAVTGTAVNLPQMFAQAMPELRTYLLVNCFSTIAACASSPANTTNNPYVPSAANQALYQSRLTYGFPTLSLAQAPREAAPAGGPDASILLATVYGGSTPAAQTIAPNGGIYGSLQTSTINQIIINTETNAIAAFYGTALSYWTRIDLYSAIGYFQNVTGTLLLAPTDRLTTDVTVGNGGTFGGNGSVLGNVTVGSGGALAPGNGSSGTLSVSSNLMFQPQSTYQISVLGGIPTSTDVSGTTSLAGNLQTQFLSGGFNKPYTVLTSGGISGTFNTITSLQPGVMASPTYTATDVSVTFSSVLGQVSGLSANEAHVGSALDRVANTAGTLPGGLDAVYALSAPQLTTALNQLSGQSLASEQSVLTSQALYSREGILARLRQGSYATSGGPQAALSFGGPDTISLDDGTDPEDLLAYAEAKKSAPTSAFPLKAPAAPVYAPSTGITFWAQGMGGWGKINGNSNVAGTTGNFAGVLSGADTRLANNWLVGFALGYSGSNTNVSAFASSAQVDTGLVAAYAGTSYGPWNLRLGGTYGINSVATTREIAFPGFMDRAAARFNAGTGQVFGELGYGVAVQSVAVEPFAGLAVVHLDTAGFTESGGASALSASGASQDTGYSSLGVRAASAYMLWNGMMLIPRASVAWQYAFGDINPATSLAFAGIPGSNFNVTGVPIARNAALIDAGADLRINPQAKVGLYYWGEHASTAHENGLRGTLTWMF